jgi:hypothetical protein
MATTGGTRKDEVVQKLPEKVADEDLMQARVREKEIVCLFKTVENGDAFNERNGCLVVSCCCWTRGFMLLCVRVR